MGRNRAGNGDGEAGVPRRPRNRHPVGDEEAVVARDEEAISAAPHRRERFPVRSSRAASPLRGLSSELVDTRLADVVAQRLDMVAERGGEGYGSTQA